MRISAACIEILLGEAKIAHPNECCGLLMGIDDNITQIQPTANNHPDPETCFEIEPAALISAYRTERAGGPKILGFYHSHPNGVPEPSATDRAMAAHDGKIWAIIGQGGIKFWRDMPDRFEPLSYSVMDS